MTLEPEQFTSEIISEKTWNQQMITHNEQIRKKTNDIFMFSAEPKSINNLRPTETIGKMY